MLLNCENALSAYVKLHDLLTIQQKMRLLLISGYDFEIRKLACK